MDNAAFLKDRKTQSAVILQLALIGEFAKRVSAPVRESTDIPWKEIAGFRDRAIHDYFRNRSSDCLGYDHARSGASDQGGAGVSRRASLVSRGSLKSISANL